jgi:hypothetical protein
MPIEFEGEERLNQTAQKYKTNRGGITAFLIRYRIIKNEGQAVFTLCFIVAMCIVLSIWIFISFRVPTAQNHLYREDIPNDVWNNMTPAQQATINSKE